MSNHVSQTGYKPTKADLYGLFNHRFETDGGLMLDCYLIYEAEERETRGLISIAMISSVSGFNEN